ncbi:MAG: YCF48-related protein [Candidatus Magasanikbacteria bacterium]|nr:YCF48-related protein [Candidatus Magasanikbacteria bacterium]
MNLKKIVLPLTVVAISLILVGQGCTSSGTQNEGVYAGPAGIFATLDAGETWQSVSKMPTLEGTKELSDVSVYRMFEDPQDTHTWYLASRKNGLFFTYDDGKTWQQSKTALTSGFVFGVAINYEDKCTIYATDGLSILKTEDCSRTWDEVYRETRTDVRVISLATNPFDKNEIYAATSNGDFMRSRDNGVSWTTIKRFGLTLGEVKLDNMNKDVIYVATRRKGLFKSVDGGLSWVNYKKELKAFSKGLEYRSFYLHPNNPNTLYWISTYGILTSVDAGVSWSPMELLTPPGGVNVYGFAINPNNDKEIYYAASSKARSTLYKSEDGGISWMTKKLPSAQLPTTVSINSGTNSAVYVGFTIPPKK